MASESINDFAVKLGVDATGVATGMAAATASILQSQRDIAKAEAIEREINLQQKIDAEEKFNKWYMSELDREFQAWYKVELQKETAAEEAAAERTRIAAEAAATQQQISINTYNAAISNERRLTTAIEEETQKQLAFSRQLQEAVIARYAAQDAAEEAAVNKADTETQAIMDNAWTRIVEQQRRTLAKFYADKAKMEQQSRDEAARLRDEEAALILATTQREHANLQRANEEEFEDLKQAIIRRNNERLRLEEEYQIRYRSAVKRAQREQADADRFRAGARTDMPAAMTATNISPATLRMVREFVAEETRANNLRENAVALIRQLATAQDLHNERVAEYSRMLAIGALNQDQYNAAIARSTQIMNASAGGFGGAGAAITQASYAAEDFIQVLSMGGGLNMALMSASNNLSMVARSVMGTSAAMSSLAGIGIPALLIGTGLLVRYLMQEEEQVDKVAEAYERLQDELNAVQDAKQRNLQHQFRMQDIASISTYAQALAEAERAARNLTESENEVAKAQEQAQLKRKEIRDSLAAGSVVAEAQRILDAMALSPEVFDWMDFATAEDDVRHLTEAYKDLADTLQHGTPEAIQVAAEEFQNVIKSTKEIGKVSSDFADKFDESLKAILGTKDETERLEKLRESLREVTAAEDKRKKNEEEIAAIQERQLQLLRQQNQQRMRDELQIMKMSEAEKEMLKLRNEQAAFAGIDTAFVGPQLPISKEAYAQITQEFMDLQLKKVQKEIEQIKKPSFAAGTEQNAFAAQAKAFEQVLKSEFDKKDTQVERLDTLIEVERQLLQAIENNGFVRVIP